MQRRIALPAELVVIQGALLVLVVALGACGTPKMPASALSRASGSCGAQHEDRSVEVEFHRGRVTTVRVAEQRQGPSPTREASLDPPEALEEGKWLSVAVPGAEDDGGRGDDVTIELRAVGRALDMRVDGVKAALDCAWR